MIGDESARVAAGCQGPVVYICQHASWRLAGLDYAGCSGEYLESLGLSITGLLIRSSRQS